MKILHFSILIEREDPPRPVIVEVFAPPGLPDGGSRATVLLLPGMDSPALDYRVQVVKPMVQRGFIVLAFDFGRNESVERDEKILGAVARGVKDGYHKLLVQRLLDVKLMIDNLHLIQARDASVKVDLARVAVLGHSLGAAQALILGGLFPPFLERPQPLKDDMTNLQMRLAAKAVFFMEGISPDRVAFSEASFRPMNVPILVATGTVLANGTHFFLN